MCRRASSPRPPSQFSGRHRDAMFCQVLQLQIRLSKLGKAFDRQQVVSGAEAAGRSRGHTRVAAIPTLVVECTSQEIHALPGKQRRGRQQLWGFRIFIPRLLSQETRVEPEAGTLQRLIVRIPVAYSSGRTWKTLIQKDTKASDI